MRTIVYSLCLIFLLSYNGFIFSEAFTLKIKEYALKLEKKLDVKIIYDQIVSDTWKLSKYQIPSDEKKLFHYLQILDKEYSKYPSGYFRKANAYHLILTQNYSFNGNHQAAMPDPYGSRLYLAIDGAYGVFTDSYLVHVIHHELQHCAEYTIWKNQYYKWPEWANLNTPDFNYGKGGITAYKDKKVNYYQMSNPIKGFVNLYSTLGQEEDRAEIFSLMMSDIERPILENICRKDPIVKNKVIKINALMNENFGEEETYWAAKNISCLSE